MNTLSYLALLTPLLVTQITLASNYTDCVVGLKGAQVNNYYTLKGCEYNSSLEFTSCVIAIKNSSVNDYYSVQGCLNNSSEEFKTCVVALGNAGINAHDSVQSCLDEEQVPSKLINH